MKVMSLGAGKPIYGGNQLASGRVQYPLNTANVKRPGGLVADQVAFSGRLQLSRPGLLSRFMMWGAVAIGTLGAPVSSGMPPIVQQLRAQQSVSTTVKADAPLTEADIKRFNQFEAWFDHVENGDLSASTRQQRINELSGYWSGLRQEAMNGNKASLKILQALWVNRMLDEVQRPGDRLVRFNDNRHTNMVNGFRRGTISHRDFVTEMQGRGLKGLYCYYAENTQSELTRDVQRLYEPVMNAVTSNPDADVQRFGGYLLTHIFRKLTPEQQKACVERLLPQYMDKGSGAQKLSTMRTLYNMQFDAPNLPTWKPFIAEVKAKLKGNLADSTSQSHEEGKYHLTLLALMRDNEVTTTVESALTPDLAPDLQEAAAWSLGRVRSPKGLKLLTTMLENPAFHLEAREMAVYSITEYHRDYPDQVNKLLATYSDKENTDVKPELREAALAMHQKLADKAETVPDFYINKLLKTDKEKNDYRRLRDQYVRGLGELTIGQKNLIDRSLLPFRQYLSEVSQRGGRHYIIQGTVTEHPAFKNLTGVRIDDGRLNDSIAGMSKSSDTLTSETRVDLDMSNTFIHEFTHHLHFLIIKNRSHMSQDVTDMYHKAMREKRVLDYYGETNEYEYLAQGGEALDSRYKGHGYLYNLYFNEGRDNSSSNTRSKLKRMDPKLYDFLKSMRSIPLELSLNILKTHMPKDYEQLLTHPRWRPLMEKELDQTAVV